MNCNVQALDQWCHWDKSH